MCENLSQDLLLCSSTPMICVKQSFHCFFGIKYIFRELIIEEEQKINGKNIEITLKMKIATQKSRAVANQSLLLFLLCAFFACHISCGT